MKYDKSVHGSVFIIKKGLPYIRKIGIVLAVLMPFFSIETVARERLADNGTFLQQDQPGVSGKETMKPVRVYDREGQFCSDLGRRKVRVGLYENKPKIFIDETGVASGIFVEILDGIARKEKWQLTYIPCEWDECLESLKDGHIDLMPDVAFSMERDKRFDFHSEEVLNSWSALYANGNNQINKMADLDGKRIAVLQNSIQQKVLKQLMNGFGYNVTFAEAKSFNDAFLMTAHHEAAAVAANHFFGNCFYQQHQLKKTPVVFNPVPLYFVTKAGSNHDLLKAIDDHLKIMKSEPKSVYYKALEDWMEKPPKVIVSPYLFWAITGFSGMLAFVFAFILLLRWQIRLKVQKMTELNKILKESETKFKDLFNKHSAVKLLLDPDHGNIVEANQAAEKFYGWPGEKIRQMRIQDINTMPAEWVKAKMKKVKSLGRTHFEFQHRLADGSIRNVEVFTSTIDIRGKTFLHSIIHDITKRKQAEKERERLQLQFFQAQKMESVGRLAGGVAHDYNNMLNIILGYAEMALGKTDPTDSLHADLKEILDAARRSVSITRHLLAFAREQVVLPVALDLNDAVENMLKMLQRLVGENIDMVWRPSVGLWTVEMDPSQVDQILANLCVNARDAIVDVGTITIETRNRVFDEAYCAIHTGFVPGEYVLLTVSDDGCGINKNVLDHIFEPFFTTKPTGKGTGLGLATVYGIVKQNNGFVNVYSESEEGTIFKLYFPRHKGKITNFTAENVEEVPLGHGEKILLVEDDPAILGLGKNMLKKLGYQVLETVSPREAIRMFEEYRSSIALLITDIIMPEMNGHDLADCLHVFDPDLKVLFLSGYTANTITCHGRVLDNKLNFLEKPFTFKDFAVNVHKALGHKREIESGTKKR